MFRYFFILLIIGLAGCGPAGPRAVRLGQEECAHCRMGIVEAKYAAQLVTAKGRSYVFDDLACMNSFVTEHPDGAAAEPGLFVADAERPAAWLPVAGAHFVRSPDFRTPMNGHTAAFATAAAAAAAQKALAQPGQLLSWHDLAQPLAAR